MKSHLGYLLFLLVTMTAPVFSMGEDMLTLMPYPKTVEVDPGRLNLTSPLRVSLSKVPVEYRKSIQELLNSIDISTVSHSKDNSPQQLVFHVEMPMETFQYPTKNADESYQITINKNGINVFANQVWGLLHATQTLRQLYDSKSKSFPYLKIKDKPRFPWRGLLVDSVRHFIPIEVIKRQLDGMASAKLNVFHWHLTDDQGWRIPIDGYPKLHQKASDGLYYNHDQITDLVNYAGRLGIRVVPEVDFPGHASAIALAYPELMSGPSPDKMQRHWGVFKPLLDPSKPDVFKFINAVFFQLNKLFPDQYVHIGGDEVKTDHWQHNNKIQAYMANNSLQSEVDLHNHFNRRIQTMLGLYGKSMVGWDEILHPQLDKDVVIQSWRGLHNLNEIVKGGFSGLLSNGYYIDQPQYTSYHYRNDPEGKLLPSPPNVETINRHENWLALTLSMPRLKGTDVAIKVWVSESYTMGMVQFNQLPLRWARTIKQNGNQLQLEVDSWKGPLTLVFNGIDQTTWLASSMIGNTPYPLHVIERKTGTLENLANNLPEKTSPQTNQVLGGEATIWSELVDGNNLDSRIWPRLYAIAERLWSPVSITDTNNMYQRLWEIDKFAQQTVGLMHHQQLRNALTKLEPQSNIRDLLTVIQMLEPAHYYTRHHIHYQQDRYHQLSSLKGLVDYLPVESQHMLTLDQHIADLTNKERFGQSRKTIKARLNAYKEAVLAIKHTATGEVKKLLPGLADDINTGLVAIEQCTKPFSSKGLTMITVTERPQSEVINAIGPRVQKLVDVCR